MASKLKSLSKAFKNSKDMITVLRRLIDEIVLEGFASCRATYYKKIRLSSTIPETALKKIKNHP